MKEKKNVDHSHLHNINCFSLWFLHRNIRTAFRDPYKPEGIYMVDPLADKKNLKNPKQPVKLLTVEGLKKALRFIVDNIKFFLFDFLVLSVIANRSLIHLNNSNASKVTTNQHSQGMRFLAEITSQKISITLSCSRLNPLQGFLF